MKIVFFILLTFLAVIGASHIVFEIMYRLFRNNNDSTFLLIIPKEKNQDIEFTLRSAVAKMKKLGKNGGTDIVLINDNLSAVQKKELDILKRDFPYVKIMSADEFKIKAEL